MDLREKEKERVNLAHLHAPASLTIYKSAAQLSAANQHLG